MLVFFCFSSLSLILLRFEDYINKSFNKTASLMAYSCQANAVLAEVSSNFFCNHSLSLRLLLYRILFIYHSLTHSVTFSGYGALSLHLTLYLSNTFNFRQALSRLTMRSSTGSTWASPSRFDNLRHKVVLTNIALQLVDDLLDFVSSADMLGKPAAADLQLGLATAPVLFASSEFPQLHAMINRRSGI